MHEHWKNTAHLAPKMKRDRSNSLAHVENNFSSMQRVSLLTEVPIVSGREKYTVFF